MLTGPNSPDPEMGSSCIGALRANFFQDRRWYPARMIKTAQISIPLPALTCACSQPILTCCLSERLLIGSGCRVSMALNMKGRRCFHPLHSCTRCVHARSHFDIQTFCEWREKVKTPPFICDAFLPTQQNPLAIKDYDSGPIRSGKWPEEGCNPILDQQLPATIFPTRHQAKPMKYCLLSSIMRMTNYKEWYQCLLLKQWVCTDVAAISWKDLKTSLFWWAIVFDVLFT